MVCPRYTKVTFMNKVKFLSIFAIKQLAQKASHLSFLIGLILQSERLRFITLEGSLLLVWQSVEQSGQLLEVKCKAFQIQQHITVSSSGRWMMRVLICLVKLFPICTNPANISTSLKVNQHLKHFAEGYFHVFLFFIVPTQHQISRESYDKYFRDPLKPTLH